MCQTRQMEVKNGRRETDEKHLGEKFDRAFWRNMGMEKDDSKRASQFYA